jgi:hypothetical protein
LNVAGQGVFECRVSKSEAFVLGPFAETKVARLPGRNPASIDVKISHLGH